MAASSSTWSSRRGRQPRKPTDLSLRVTPQLFNRGTFGDPAVPPDLTPILIRRPWTLGARGRTTRVNLSELNMHYGHVRAISRSVGAITVRSSGIQPWGDVVVLARTATRWQRINLENGSVTFCRRTRRGNVAELFVIADNTTVTPRTPAPTKSADRPHAPHTAP